MDTIESKYLEIDKVQKDTDRWHCRAIINDGGDSVIKSFEDSLMNYPANESIPSKKTLTPAGQTVTNHSGISQFSSRRDLVIRN